MGLESSYSPISMVEESSNSQAVVKSNESDNIKIQSFVGPSSKEPSKSVKMWIWRPKQTQDPSALRRSHKKN